MSLVAQLHDACSLRLQAATVVIAARRDVRTCWGAGLPAIAALLRQAGMLEPKGDAHVVGWTPRSSTWATEQNFVPGRRAEVPVVDLHIDRAALVSDPRAVQCVDEPAVQDVRLLEEFDHCGPFLDAVADVERELPRADEAGLVRRIVGDASGKGGEGQRGDGRLGHTHIMGRPEVFRSVNRASFLNPRTTRTHASGVMP